MHFKTIYNYLKTDPNQPDDSEPSLNVMAGFIRRTQRSSKGAPGLYLRYYYGVNPAGQFRSQSNYRLFGFGLLFDL